MKFKSGWIPDRPDFRDWWFDLTKIVKPKPSKSKVDLRDKLPLVWTQRNIGSCTGFGVGAMLEYNRIQEKQSHFFPSPLFIYYNARKREGTINSDSGAYIRTAIKSVANEGAASDEDWPYIIEKWKDEPPQVAYQHALKFKALSYYRLDNTKLDVLKTCLNESECFVFGSTLYSSFFEANHNGGIVKMPNPKEKEVGGHCMLCCGFIEKEKRFIIRNSWGREVGDNGYFYMPYEYLTDQNLTDDCWTIKTTS